MRSFPTPQSSSAARHLIVASLCHYPMELHPTIASVSHAPAATTSFAHRAGVCICVCMHAFAHVVECVCGSMRMWVGAYNGCAGGWACSCTCPFLWVRGLPHCAGGCGTTSFDAIKLPRRPRCGSNGSAKTARLTCAGHSNSSSRPSRMSRHSMRPCRKRCEGGSLLTHHSRPAKHQQSNYRSVSSWHLCRFHELQADEAWKEQNCRLCPHCGRTVNKLDGATSELPTSPSSRKS